MFSNGIDRSRSTRCLHHRVGGDALSISSFDVRGAALPGAFLFVLLYMFVAVVLSIELTSGV